VWFYKKFFGSSINVLPLISVPQPFEVLLVPSKTEKENALEPVSEVTEMTKRFNIILHLMNQRRTYQKYTIAKLAQIMQLQSIGELESVFLGKCEPNFELIDHFCGCFRIYEEWLVNGEITPYFNGYGQHLMTLDYLEEIKLSKPERIFFVRCDAPVGEAIIILKFSN
jgi:hypothetical protein